MHGTLHLVGIIIEHVVLCDHFIRVVFVLSIIRCPMLSVVNFELVIVKIVLDILYLPVTLPLGARVMSLLLLL